MAGMNKATSWGWLLGGSAKYPGDEHPELRLDDNPAKNIIYFSS